MGETLESPTFSATMDVLEAIRKDEAARRELESLLMYLSDPASRHEALSSLRAALTDQMQLLRNDDDLVPIYHVLAEALASSVRDRDNPSNVIQAGFVDAHTSLLSRLAARERDAEGVQICRREIDPNQVLTVVLRNIVTPMKDAKGTLRRTPFDVILDVIGDVNRSDPSREGRLESADIAAVSNEVSDFLANKERGLEQFYQIIKNGTR
jgi:hypothetical protein